MTLKGIVCSLVVSVAGLAIQTATAQELDKVRAAGVLNVPVVIGGEPHFHKAADGQWSGHAISIYRDLGEELGLKVQFVETTWGNMVLDLQSEKIDLAVGLNPTPKRALAVSFSQPVWYNRFCVVARDGFEPGSWGDMNKPEVTVAYDIGSSHEAIAKAYTPNATLLGLKSRPEVLLSVSGGHADVFVNTALSCLAMKKNQTALGNLHFPAPLVATAASFATRPDQDRRLLDFLNAWVEFNRGNGNVRGWIIDGLKNVNVDPAEVPADLQF